MRAWFITGWLVGLAGAAMASVPNDTVLMGAYLQTHLTHMVGTQIDTWCDTQNEDAEKALQKALGDWNDALLASSRKKLTTQFGGEENAKKALSAFVSAFTQAEKNADQNYLESLCGRMKLEPPWPADYSGLRKAALQTSLAVELNDASSFLSAVEIWLEQKKQGTQDVPDLDTWLDATLYKKSAGSGGTSAKKGKPAPPADPLADSEASLGGFTSNPDEEGNPLADYRASRAAKRKRALEQARDGMITVAKERQDAEQEVASKKLAAAQAEAAALQRHAEKLAAVEKDALDQRQNSWTSKLKNIVASTVSTATGVFFGSVGQRAGEAVTDAVFNDKK
jgi:hypothetical protein